MKQLAFFIFILLISSNTLANDNEKPIQVKWKYKNWMIDNTSVCYNHKRGSIDYRKCEKRAVQVFKQRCKKYTKDADKLGYRYNEKASKQKRMYCLAASTYTSAR